MKFDVPEEDARVMRGLKFDIRDTDVVAGDGIVGELTFKEGGGRQITFYNQYTGTFQTHAECVAFAKGVETVLNHMLGV